MLDNRHILLSFLVCVSQELGLGFLVNVNTPKPANLSSNEFYLVLRVVPELHSFFSCSYSSSSSSELSCNACSQNGVFLHALSLLWDRLKLLSSGAKLVVGTGRQ